MAERIAVSPHDVRTAYIQARSDLESLRFGRSIVYRPPPGYDGTGAVVTSLGAPLAKAKTSVWILVARKFEEQGLDPRAYIPTVFDLMDPSEPIPVPGQLLSYRMKKLWQQVKETGPPDPGVELTSARMAANAAIKYRREFGGMSQIAAVLSVVADRSVDISPLFRYCLAMSYQTKSSLAAAGRIAVAAQMQLQTCPELYIKTWGGMIPQRMLERIGYDAAGQPTGSEKTHDRSD